MAKSRVEVNAEGEFYVTIPEDIVEDLQIEDGEPVSIYEDDGAVLITFG